MKIKMKEKIGNSYNYCKNIENGVDSVKDGYYNCLIFRIEDEKRERIWILKR
ncbi:MAG: hypothetical protein VZT48_00360 [Bulleidia sp.]|nr:hypothetical protein [Bulleidia sp.]